MSNTYFVRVVPSANDDNIVEINDASCEVHPPRFNDETIWDELNQIVRDHTEYDLSRNSRLIVKSDYDYMIFASKSETIAMQIRDLFHNRSHHDYVLKSNVIAGKGSVELL
tara:strand:- start:108 stop:440 length:333 start_codon:yes stop_codon:yes gene_type:complete